MAQIVLSHPGASFLLRKRINTFGGAPEHDVRIPGAADVIAFSVVQEVSGYSLLPAAEKVRLNGQAVSRRTPLKHCDRLEWRGCSAVFLDSSLPADAASHTTNGLESLQVLQNLAASLRQEGSAAVNHALEAIVQLAGAEEGYLLTECKSKGEWGFVASEGADGRNKKGLFSSTILKEALVKRAPVYVESIVGHPFAENASVIAARVFSVACFPLVINEEILGAVFLYTRTPGKTIRQGRLAEINLLATQVALLLALDLRAQAPTAPDSGQLLFRENSPMAEVQAKIRKLAPTPVNILILGETGTGKEVVARSIHQGSSRKAAPFVPVNCAAIPAALLESVLFGHERGAFTGAVKAQVGKFQQAEGGTLFLDEIGDLPLELQAKLLRAIQEREIEPLGSEKTISIDVRLLAATHQNLEKAVKDKRFRQDLYFRLAGAKILLPPLRERSVDIPLLAEHFLAVHGAGKSFAPACMDIMQKYPWPGNVREIEQAVMRASYLADGNELLTEHLELELAPSFVDDKEQFWESFDTLTSAQSAFTRSLVEKTLQKHSGNRSQAAERLGISERTLYRILAESDRG